MDPSNRSFTWSEMGNTRSVSDIQHRLFPTQKQVQQQAVNHFAGKEQVLQQAMEKMSKLKSKYSSLNSLKDIPKRRPNEMRGKPLREPLLPGIALQIQKKADDILVDFNPNVGYRLSGRLTSGLGWNQRVGIILIAMPLHRYRVYMVHVRMENLDWVKDFRHGSVKGTAMIMLRVFNVDHKSPFTVAN